MLVPPSGELTSNLRRALVISILSEAMAAARTPIETAKANPKVSIVARKKALR
jgi:hypothetical protein